MFSVTVLRSLRPGGVCRSLSSAVHISTAPFTVSCVAKDSGNQLRVLRRSFLLQHHKQVLSHCLSSRCLSTGIQTEDGNLIYTGSLATAVRGVKTFSYSTSGASLILMPQILFQTGMGVEGLGLQLFFFGAISFFTFLTPCIIHLVTKGYVIRMYHKPETDTYTAVTYNVFLREKKNVFHQTQVNIPPVSKMFTTFYADKMGLLVNPDTFSLPNDYNHLMGYDKPFTFRLDQSDES